MSEYGNSVNFSNFLSEELIPYMDEHYKTSEPKGIVGESLARLFVMEILFHKPELFSHYIAIDPSLWWNNHKLMDEVINRFDFKILRNKKLWISTSRTVAIKMFTEELVELLRIKDIPLQNWQYLQDPHQTHFTIFKATIENALHWSFKKV